MSALLFVYGSLKQGCSNHRLMAGQTFIGEARTEKGYRLYDLNGYPAIARNAEDRDGVFGEVWQVDAPGLEKLDQFEGVHEGLYRRERIVLQPPYAEEEIFAYFAGTGVMGRREIGTKWPEPVAAAQKTTE